MRGALVCARSQRERERERRRKRFLDSIARRVSERDPVAGALQAQSEEQERTPAAGRAHAADDTGHAHAADDTGHGCCVRKRKRQTDVSHSDVRLRLIAGSLAARRGSDRRERGRSLNLVLRARAKERPRKGVLASERKLSGKTGLIFRLLLGLRPLSLLSLLPFPANGPFLRLQLRRLWSRTSLRSTS